MNDWLKAAAIFPGYLVIAPALGWLLSRRRTWERAALCLLVFMPSWFPSKITLMLDSIEWYRGHTKGFEGSLIEILALALIVCAALRREQGFRWMPPGAWLYLTYCALSCLSVFPAMNKVFALMAVVKFTSAVLIFVGAFQAFRDATDLRWLLHMLAFSLLFQAVLALKLRYLNGQWQVHGWFEHQNSMAMWAYLTSLPLLAVAFAPGTPRRDTLVFLVGVAAAALLILLTVSRAALAAFTIGSTVVVLLAMAHGVSMKLISITTVGLVGAVAAGLLALDAVRARVREAAANDEEIDLRGVLIVQSHAMLHDHPFGIGWNNYGLANSLPAGQYAQIMMDWDESRGFHIYEDNYYANPLPESLYCLVLAETGYAGFAAFITFMAVTLWWAMRNTLAFWRSPTGWFVGGLLVALSLTYFHGTVERVLTQTKNLAMWLILAGCLARIELNRRQGRDLNGVAQ